MVCNKITTTNTYLANTNFWTPLLDDDNDEPTTEEESSNITRTQQQQNSTPPSNKWTRRLARRRERRQVKEDEQIIIDSGATSHFVTETLNLPKTGPSELTVYLPDDSTLKSTGTTLLPFTQLSPKAREANILPGLTKSLISVNTMAENGYLTIFQPWDGGVTIHKEGTLKITTSEPPVLQGCKKKGTALWTVSVPQTTKKKQEEIANVYNLPSIVQMIKYHHASAGYPVEDTWIKAINAGNYTTWPGLTAEAVRKHFPESDETQKGHMKRQRQGVRSTRLSQSTLSKEDQAAEDSPGSPANKKMKDVYVKVHMASETIFKTTIHSLTIERHDSVRCITDQADMILISPGETTYCNQ